MRDFSSSLDDGIYGRVNDTTRSEYRALTMDVLVWGVWMRKRDEV